MINILVSLHPDPKNPGSGLVEYKIPELGMNEQISYRLIPRKKVDGFVKYGDGHTILVETNERSKNVEKKHYDKSVLTACLDMVFLPTFLLSDPENRVAIDHDPLVTFMQNVINEYAGTFKPKKKSRGWLWRVLFGEDKPVESYEQILKCDASMIASEFQKVGIGLWSRNPYGVCWDCLVPNVWESCRSQKFWDLFSI